MMESDQIQNYVSADPALNRFAESAHALAESHQLVRSGAGRLIPLLDHFKDYKAALTEIQHHFTEIAENELLLPYAGEWLLDNSYVIQQALQLTQEDMPPGYYRRLPKLDFAEPKGLPRVFALACSLVNTTSSPLNIDEIIDYCSIYQQITPLQIGEIWALPVMLRAGILERLIKALYEIAELDFDLPEATSGFEWTSLNATDIVANSVRSLLLLSYQDWNAFFEAVSLVEAELRADPAGIYALMDRQTRNRYREAVERIAHLTGHDEQEITRHAVNLAQQASAAEPLSSDFSEWRPGPGYQGYVAHVGYYLVDEGVVRLEQSIGHNPNLSQQFQRWAASHSTTLYLASIAIVTSAALLLIAVFAAQINPGILSMLLAILLTALPISTAAIQLIDWCIMRLLTPRLLPRMAFEEDVPDAFRTLIVMPVLAHTPADIDTLFSQLEMHYLRNGDNNLYYALLADLTDAPQEHMPEDEALIAYGNEQLQTLNARYASSTPFYFLLRRRRWNPGEQIWMGWERKRGKLAMLNQLLLDPSADTDYNLQSVDVNTLSTIRYVITLDADTILPTGSAQALIGTLAHPLNRAVYAADSRVIKRGYTVLQPRIEILQIATQQSLFTRLYAGDTGLDLYTLAVSNLYQDLFGDAIYVGKGIYEVTAFEHSLENSIPENSLLSHDLLEGAHGRVALVTDISLIEDYPTHYLAHQERIHRWIRGDWQLLPWVLKSVAAASRGQVKYTLSAINIWKILDNLRRNLVPISLLALFLCAWFGLLPGSGNLQTASNWTAFGLLLSFSPFWGLFFNHALSVLFMPPSNRVQKTFTNDLTRWALSVAFLLYEALIALDAIIITLYRLIRRQHLLQWTSAAHINRLFRNQNDEDALVWQRMSVVLIVDVIILLAITIFQPDKLVITSPLLTVWAVSPILAKYISRPIPEKVEHLSQDDHRELRKLARRTWLYFEDFVGPASHWLPPDHYRAAPRAAVTYSTSPTNIGLLMLATLAAHDLGYLGAHEMVLRLRLTFDSLDRLERYRGHFLNWYDAQTLQPLPPRYVSTVDSGNLASSLIALRQGLYELAKQPVIDARRWRGLSDLLDILEDLLRPITDADLTEIRNARIQIETVSATPLLWPQHLTRFEQELMPQLGQSVAALLENQKHRLTSQKVSEIRLILAHLRQQVVSLQRDLDTFVPWLGLIGQIPQGANDPTADIQAIHASLAVLPPLSAAAEVYDHAAGLAQAARSATALNAETAEWLDTLQQALEKASEAANLLMRNCAELDPWIHECIQAHDFSFLFDSERCLFHIGYNIGSEQLDNSYYDLLASEARIASYIALAKGDVPQEHWLHLGRPMTSFREDVTLLSWSGTMFEYLMPVLLMRNYPNTLLHQSYRTVVDQQMTYAAERHVPWGISESGYHVLDSNLNYQYRAFGIPQQAFKRGMESDLVIAPYASILALPIRPQAVIRNMTHLEQLEMLGAYGFYEAIDYTQRHLTLGDENAIVREYMAHHQGMIMVALDNALNHDVMVQRFHTDPQLQSVELLLQEKIPSHPALRFPETERDEIATTRVPHVSTPLPWAVSWDTAQPYLHSLSNGRYTVMLTNTGGGYSQLGEIGLTRFTPDAALDEWGTWIYLQDLDLGEFWSAGYAPTAKVPDEYAVRFFPYMVEYVRRDDDITLKMEVTVSPDDDVEIRRITLTNHGTEVRSLFLTDYAEVALSPQEADRRHPAFNKLFIQSEYLADQQGLLFRRRPRSQQEQSLFLFHRLIIDIPRSWADSPFSQPTSFETDRAQFLGRGQTARSPQAFRQQSEQLSGSIGSTLDPIMALGQAIRLEAYSTVQLAFVTIAQETREQIDYLAGQYRAWSSIEQTFDAARYQSSLEMRQLQLEQKQLEFTQRLLSALIYPRLSMRAAPETLAANTKGQNGLWAYGISGDYPILMVKISNSDQIPLIQDLVQAHTYWRNRNHKVTLVIVNLHDVGYRRDLYQQIHRLIVRMGSELWIGRHDGIFVLNMEQLNSEADRILLETSASVVLDASDGELAQQIKRTDADTSYLPIFRPTGADHTEVTASVQKPTNWLFDNGLGGFSPDQHEYQIFLAPGQHTPAPWSNVIANSDFGFLVTEAGGGLRHVLVSRIALARHGSGTCAWARTRRACDRPSPR